MKNKPIWVALDTETVSDWLCQCPDELNDYLVGEDGDEVDDETFERAIDWVIERSTDGRLSKELTNCLFNTWLGEKFNDMLWDVTFDFIHDELTAFAKHEGLEV